MTDIEERKKILRKQIKLLAEERKDLLEDQRSCRVELNTLKGQTARKTE